MITHYDTLGVRPGDPSDVIHRRVDDEMHQLLEPYWYLTSMKRAQRVQRMQAMLAAYAVVGHDTHRKPYNKKLRELMVICPLCDGTGRVPMGEKNMMGEYKQFMPCAPCGGTGKAEPPMEVKRV